MTPGTLARGIVVISLLNASATVVLAGCGASDRAAEESGPSVAPTTATSVSAAPPSITPGQRLEELFATMRSAGLVQIEASTQDRWSTTRRGTRQGWVTDYDIAEHRWRQRVGANASGPWRVEIRGVAGQAYSRPLGGAAKPGAPWARYADGFDAKIRPAYLARLTDGTQPPTISTLSVATLDGESSGTDQVVLTGTVPLKWAIWPIGRPEALVDIGLTDSAQLEGAVPIRVRLDSRGRPQMITLDFARLRNEAGTGPRGAFRVALLSTRFSATLSRWGVHVSIPEIRGEIRDAN